MIHEMNGIEYYDDEGWSTFNHNNKDTKVSLSLSNSLNNHQCIDRPSFRVSQFLVFISVVSFWTGMLSGSPPKGWTFVVSLRGRMVVLYYPFYDMNTQGSDKIFSLTSKVV